MYGDAERAIFEYFNGEQKVFGDPLAIRRRLIHELSQYGDDPDQLISNWRAGAYRKDDVPEGPEREAAEEQYLKLEPVRYAAAEKIYPAVRVAFRMASFDPATGHGALEADCIKALEDYFAWMTEKKTTAGNSVTSALPTDGSPMTSPSMPSMSGS